MTSARPDVRDFFRRYHSAGEDLNSEALASMFCGVFMSRQLFEAIGSDGLELADISEMPLDEVHTLVRTSWRLRMRDQAPGDPICLLSTFILRREAGAWRIVLYLNHQDMNKLFSELAPALRATGPAR